MIKNIVPNTVVFVKIFSDEKLFNLTDFGNIIIFFQKCLGK